MKILSAFYCLWVARLDQPLKKLVCIWKGEKITIIYKLSSFLPVEKGIYISIVCVVTHNIHIAFFNSLHTCPVNISEIIKWVFFCFFYKMIVILKLIMIYNTNKPASSYSRVVKFPLQLFGVYSKYIVFSGERTPKLS